MDVPETTGDPPMTHSRQRHLGHFEARSLQIIAACTLGLAGMSTAQANASPRSSGASPTALSAPAPAAATTPRNLTQRNAVTGQRRSGKLT
jgi:hypothetical protein